MIIGIGNKARQGKDTAGAYLQRKYGFNILHFADPIYDECRKCNILFNREKGIFYLKPPDENYYVFENPPPHVIGWIEENGESRDDLPFNSDIIYTGMKNKDSIVLQFWGTDFRRKIYGWDFWLKKIEKILLDNREKDYCLPDTRFINEAELIKSLGGYVWRVIRPEYNVTDRKTSHTSETELDNWDYDIVMINSGTIPDLYGKVDEEYSKLRLKNE
ncbi:hypothetical protein ACFL4T_05280 [candidate division KSB1 bacterium]